MSENQSVSTDETAGEELARVLARKGKRGRAKSTTALIAVLLVLLGVLIGVPLGRATAPGNGTVGPETAEQGPQRGGPFGGGRRP